MPPRLSFGFAARSPHLSTLTAAAACTLAVVAVAPPSFAAVPTGWSLTSSIDGGTSSLGSSIATTDTIAVVGAPFATSTGAGMPPGAAFVYTKGGASWTSQEISAPSPIAGGDFGTSVAASGNLIAVGAAGTPPAAYVFAGDGGSYAPAQTWTDPTSDKNASFGGSVAVHSGGPAGTSYVAIAAPPGSSNPAGTVYVSRQVAGGAWTTLAPLTDPSAESFGISLAFATNGELLVGDPGTGSGQVLIYAPEADGGWESAGTLPFSLAGGSVQQFGNGIATASGMAVVAAPGTTSDGGAYNGAVFVFSSDDAGVWSQQAVLTSPSAESFANYIPAIGDGIIAVGSAINTASSGTGRVDVWAWNGSVWVSVPSSSLVGDTYYGQAVGIAGGALFAGDTSALGASSISAVTSSLFIETPEYGDAGAQADGATGEHDASAPAADGSTPLSGADASSPLPDAGASSTSGGDGSVSGAGGAPTPAAGGSGCSCTSAGNSDQEGSGLLALLAESALALLILVRRRQTSPRPDAHYLQ